jgi:acyl-[acyl-carrier-protein]-phospholipid O-acyltransferase/long-chain-fatty-acid--[acyl-carrier-protein] ligase
MKTKPPSLGAFHWHNAAQFGGALNDNLFKLAVIYAMVFAWPGKDTNEVNAVVGAVFAIPFLLFIGAAGVLADRVAKHRIVLGIKLMEVGVMTLGAIGVYFQSREIMLLAMFAMSVQSALFSPTKFSIVPELVGRENISRANSFMSAASYLAMIIGTAAAPFFAIRLGRGVGLASVAIAALGLYAASRIPPTPVAGGNAKASMFFLRDIYKTLKWVHQDGFLALAVWSSSFFLMIAAFVQLNMLTYGIEHLGMADQQQATSLFLIVAFGIGIGSLLAGKVSRRGIEFGIVPIGSTLLAVSCVGLWGIPQGAVNTAYFFSFLMGLGAGFFIVPVQSFLQFRSPPEKMGEVIAASGWLSWLGVLLAAGLLYLCSAILNLTGAQSFLLIGAMVAVFALASFFILPDFFVRFIGILLTRCFYRLRAGGLENIPSQGPALLVANHVSLMDALWITATQQRRIRFLMSRDFLQKCPGWIQKLLKLNGVIPIQEDDNPKAILAALKAARQALDDGFLVAIFPEGHLSRTGHMLPFKPGFERIVKNSNIPVVPVYIEGGYGTRASFAKGAPLLLRGEDFRTQITVSIGTPLPATSTVEEVRTALQNQAATATDAYAPIRGSAGRSFVRTAKKYWKRLAVADSAGKELTYGRTLIASLLLRKKLRVLLKDDPETVGVLIPPSAGGALVNLALAMDFRVAVNLNYTASESAIRSAMTQTGMKTLITSRKVMEKFPDFPVPDRVIYAEDISASIGKAEKVVALLKARFIPNQLLVRDRDWNPSDPLTVLFSSGSTAEPKGVKLSHHNILSNIDGFSVVARAQDDDCICAVLPFFHSMGYTTTLWFPLLRGLGVAYHHHPLETDAIGRIAGKYKATILVGTPTFLMAWVRKIDPESFAHLRWVCVGAEKLRPKLSDMFEKRYGIRPLEGYGATECSPVIAVNVPDVEADGLNQTGCRECSVGRALPNLITRITDPDTGEELPADTPGLLWVKGPSVMPGYLNNPEKTDEVLQDGWYNTGDIVKKDKEGFITITDRLTRFSKLAGEMVSHSAVETALQEALGCASDALAVTGVSDEKKGERLIVVYQRDLGDAADFQDAVRKANIPNLWKPDSNAWIPVDALPVLGTGKLDLKGLKEVAKEK